MAMTRQELINRSEAYIRRQLKEHIPSQARVYLYGSRARRDHRWNSDYDIWIDADIPRRAIAEMTDQFEESFVPFRVDIVTTPQLDGRFAERVRQEATPWM
jgi:predicted nucleotidyltransferase